ncbi:MAG: L-2-hydroxyglutarate oxidase [SAR202 cluster bacterium]|nr:L-2-hydroxyglutarate oxidase [Chloroflexota bacterium]MQG50840.1 L-2-hydroxyglutarate oxidase [SAR202 cluster bacterium]
MSGQYDIAIIGGGILGLATAMTITKNHPNQKVVLVEKEDTLAKHQTGHNSGVIHAGLYYRPGSQKASFCVDGARNMREFCDEHNIKYDLVGKVVVATNEEEIPRLENLFERGTANGVEGLTMIGPERLKEIEPHASGVQAIHSPNTGIVDYIQVSQAYATEYQEAGGDLFTNSEVVKINEDQNGYVLTTKSGEYKAKYLINCAGLYADKIVNMIGEKSNIKIIPFRGEYFELTEDSHHLVNGLIYPVPDPKFPFLGVHYTRLINGGVEAGPNAVLAFAKEGYKFSTVNPKEFLGTLSFSGFWIMAAKYWKTGMSEMYRSLSKKSFTRSLQKLVPEIREENLVSTEAGVRAQAVDSTGFLLDDFSIIQTARGIHVQNAPSPAATSSLSIGKYVADLAQSSFSL